MKKNSLVLGILVLVAVAMTSCFGPSNEPSFVEADLLGLWQRKVRKHMFASLARLMRLANTSMVASGMMMMMSMRRISYPMATVGSNTNS